MKSTTPERENLRTEIKIILIPTEKSEDSICVRNKMLSYIPIIFPDVQVYTEFTKTNRLIFFVPLALATKVLNQIAQVLPNLHELHTLNVNYQINWSKVRIEYFRCFASCMERFNESVSIDCCDTFPDPPSSYDGWRPMIRLDDGLEVISGSQRDLRNLAERFKDSV